MIKWIMYVYTLKDGIKFDGEARPLAMPIFILYVIICFLSLLVPLEGYGLCLWVFLRLSFY